MFMSEHILLNTSISVLQQVDSKKDTWEVRDIIFTDRALYIFAQVQNQREQFLNYLTAPWERLNMKNFEARVPMENDNDPEPIYLKHLPRQNGPYYIVIELYNFETEKIRLLSLKSKDEAEVFVNLFNLISCFRIYEQKITDEGGDIGNGPQFIPNWVRTYTDHRGQLEFTVEMLNRKNIKYLMYFAENNPAIRSLIFGEALLFLSSGKKQVRDEHNHELAASVFKIINDIRMVNVTELRFNSNEIDDGIFKHFSQCLSTLNKLKILEISYNDVGDETLNELASILNENKNLEEINLSNNKLGNSGSDRSLTSFLESFLLELKDPQKLDLSCNQIGDECLESILFYLLANHNCEISHLNIEYNSFSNYAKRTIAQACLLCPNQNLKVRSGPISLTQDNLSMVISRSKKQLSATNIQKDGEDKGQLMQFLHPSLGLPNPLLSNTRGQKENQMIYTLAINRKAANPKIGLRYLPIGKQESELLESYKNKIEQMCYPDRRNTIYSEDIRDLVDEITELQIEFPKHLMQPLFHMINQKIDKAIQENNLYHLEILLDALDLMDSSNKLGQEKYEELKLIAMNVSANLLRAINMEIHDDNELLRMLVENLNRAKEIGMRGEIIDIATTLKALCKKLLQEMLAKTSNSDEEDDPSKQVFMLKEEDLRRSVYDPYYDQFIDHEDTHLSADLEPNIALHPYRCDYLNIASLNLNYLKKNMALSRKLLAEEETYSLLNIYIRCAFILCDNKQDSSKSPEFYNARNDKLLRYARILFRYRHNLDGLVQPGIEPTVSLEFSKAEKDKILKRPTWEGVQSHLRIENYPGLSKESAMYSEKEISRPLISRINNLKQAAIKFNQQLCQIQQQGSISIKKAYKMIRTLFEDYIVRSSTLLFEDMADEMYMQVFRQCNGLEQVSLLRPMFLVLAFLSRYMLPSNNLIPYIEEWLLRKKLNLQKLEHLIKVVLVNIKVLQMAGRPEKGLYVCWPPSYTEIQALDLNKPVKIKVLYPNGYGKEYEIDESTTVESLLKSKIYPNDKSLFRGGGEPQLYWLFYSYEDDYEHFPMPLSREKKLLKLLYMEEKRLDKNVWNANFNMRASSIMRTSSIGMKDFKQQNMEEDYKRLTLRLRQRIFTSLHAVRNFNKLNKEALNFLFNQAKNDYIEFEILKMPKLSIDDASRLAALALQVKRYKKILTSKDNTLKREEIKKNLEYCVPYSLLKDRKQAEQLDLKILQVFEQENIRDLTIEEAQDKFLSHLANYQFTFGSYYTMRRKVPNLLQMGPKSIKGIQSLKQLQQQQNMQSNIRGRRKTPLEIRMKGKSLLGGIKKQGSRDSKSRANKSKSKFDDDDSNDDNETSEESSGSGENSEIAEEDSIEEEDDNDESTPLDHSNFSNETKDQSISQFEHNSEYLDDLIPGVQTELLMIIKYESILFIENSKRDKVILEVKNEDLLYVMGKDNMFMIAFQMHQGNTAKGSALKMRQQTSNENFQHDNIIDVKTVFEVPNARVIAEDIIAYIQINLVEKTKGKDYIEVTKPQFVDFLTQDDFRGYEKSLESIDVNSDHQGNDQGKNQQINVVVDDDLLLGVNKFKQTNMKHTIEMGSKHQFNKDSPSKITQATMLDAIKNDDHQSDFSDESALSESASRKGSLRKLTPEQRYDRKISQRAGFQFKFKKPDFMIYTKRHPSYTLQTAGGAEQSLMQIKQSKLNTSLLTNTKKQKVIEAREMITGLSFALENHTINEEEEDVTSQSEQSQNDLVSQKHSKSNSSMSNFASLPRRGDALAQINEIEEETFEGDGIEKRDNYISANAGKTNSLMVNEEMKHDTLSQGRMSKVHIHVEVDRATQNAPVKANQAPTPPHVRSGTSAYPFKGEAVAPKQSAPEQQHESDANFFSKGQNQEVLPSPATSAPVQLQTGGDSKSVSSVAVSNPPKSQIGKQQQPVSAAAPFDFKTFLAGSQQNNQRSDLGTENSRDREKKEVAQAFDKMRSDVPKAVGQFEKKGKDALRTNMAKTLMNLPPPPPKRV